MALQEIVLKLCGNQKETPRGFISNASVDEQYSKPLYSLWHLSHRVISLAVCSSPWMSVMELSPLLSVSTPIRSLPLSLASLALLRWARDVTTFASVPRSPWDGSSCWAGKNYQACFISKKQSKSIHAYRQTTIWKNNNDRTGLHHIYCVHWANIPFLIISYECKVFKTSMFSGTWILQ